MIEAWQSEGVSKSVIARKVECVVPWRTKSESPRRRFALVFNYLVFPRAVMNQSNVQDLLPANRSLNAVALQHAVLCVECDVVSNSPHDICMVCGSRSLINISRMLGGNLPKNRARLVIPRPAEPTWNVALEFPRPHRVRRRRSAR